MKKLFLSLVAVLCCSASLYADDLPEELVATLNHEGTLSAYYGTTAFVEAMENAENGDEITLTGGVFDSPDYSITYEKAVTIRGAGVKEVKANKTKATEITDNLTFDLPADTNEKLFIEGVRLNDVTVKSSELIEATISKCTASEIRCEGSLLTVINCDVDNVSSTDIGYAYFKNCVINRVNTSKSFHCTYEHCLYKRDSISANAVSHSVFRHCIIKGFDYYYDFPYTVQFFNCILVDVKRWNGGETYYCKAQMESCYIIDDMNVQLYGKSSVSVFTHLTEEAQSLYPSTDGTEIGIYGGEYPYTDDITLPYVTNLVIGDRTANGKLPVTIEVK